jgi:8-oxo-dGTP diphosphatase
MKCYTCGFYFTYDLQYVLLIEKARPDWQAGKYNGIGGKIEEGEDPIACMIREFEEETGYDIAMIAWEGTHVLTNSNDLIFFYRGLGEKFDVDDYFPGGDEKPRWIPVSEINNYNILPNISWMVPMLASTCGVFDQFEMESYREGLNLFVKERLKRLS